MPYDLLQEFRLPATPQRVMQLLTDSLLIRKWSGQEAVLETVVGGRFEMFDGWVKGVVTKINERELAYTWKPAEYDENTPATEVHYELKKDEVGTLVLLQHKGFPNEEEMVSHKDGWNDFVFTPLEDYIMVTEKP